jgi:hypothetical protein
MANPTTTAQHTASTAIDEAVRIAAEGSRRTAESAEAAVQASRKYFELGVQVNRDLVGVLTATADASLQTAFDVQNAALSSAVSALDTWTNVSKDAFRRWADLARQTQSVTLKTSQASSKLFESLTVN